MKYYIFLVLFLNFIQTIAQSKIIRFQNHLPYSYGKFKDSQEDKVFSTAYLPDKERDYIIVDSIGLPVSDADSVLFYFLTPIKAEINLSCPEEYGLIVLDNNGKIIYKLFWDMFSESALSGNYFPNILQFKSNSNIRNLLSLSSSGCGSGYSTQYYDIKYSNNMIAFTKSISCEGGYSDYYFIPEKYVYLKIERLDPECQYSCPSKYSINTYNLFSDQLLKSSITKLMYEDYNDSGIDDLLNSIKNKEPNLNLE